LHAIACSLSWERLPVQSPTLTWRVEETCLKAWPALREVSLEDWLVRFADGLSRRANSANPRRAQIGDVAGSIAACAALYRAEGQPAIFRIPAFVDPAVDRELDGLGYGLEGETVTLHGVPAELVLKPDPDVEISSRPSADWLASMARLQRHSEQQNATYRRILQGLALRAGFAALRHDGELTALAYGVVHDSIYCCESVVTDARHRGRGFAHRLLGALNAWAESEGARLACLQVEATNTPARTLYRSIGLKAELYRYHYRREPISI
jgi:N-acetylglutamate synthase